MRVDARQRLLRAEPGLGRADAQGKALAGLASKPQQGFVARQQPLHALCNRQVDEFLIGRIGAGQPAVGRTCDSLDMAADA